MRSRGAVAVTGLAAVLSACAGSALPFATPTPVLTRPPERQGIVVAVIGAAGFCATFCNDEQAVADMVHRWVPDFIVNLGDSTFSQPRPSQAAADMRPYAKDIAAGQMLSLVGTDDLDNTCDQSVADPVRAALHITSPNGVEHLGGGLLDLFFLNSTCGSPVGYDRNSQEARQYAVALQASTARWRVTATHHPAFSSDPGGGLPALRWIVVPGVDLYLAGHDHDFEHLEVGGHQFVVDGVGGRSINLMCQSGCAPGSVWHDDTSYGAVRLSVTTSSLTVDFVAMGGQVLHSFTLHKG